MKRQWITNIRIGCLACSIICGLAACVKEDMSSKPLDVTLNINTRSLMGDMDAINQLRIFAFHVADDETRTLVGHICYSQANGEEVSMRLQQAGKTEFRVIANERYGMQNQQDCLNSNMELQDLDEATINAFSKDTDNEYATPMSNPTKNNSGVENRIFDITGTNPSIEIELKRSVSRVRFYFARTESTESLVINKISFNRGVGLGYLFLPEDATDYTQYDPSQLNNMFSTRPAGKTELTENEITVTNVVGDNDNITVSNSQKGPETYLFPCPYGSENPDKFTWNGPGNYSSDYAYYATIEYTVDGNHFSKEVYLPCVGQNQTFDVLCKIPPAGKDVQPTLVVRTQTWAYIENPDIEFD